VDRGLYSLETVSLLFALKARYVSCCLVLVAVLISFVGTRIELHCCAEITKVGRLHKYTVSMVCASRFATRCLLDLVNPDECQQKYGSATVWKACCGVFDFLNLAAVRHNG